MATTRKAQSGKTTGSTNSKGRSSSPLRFRPDPLADSYIRLIDVLFAFVLGQGFREHKDLIVNPGFSSQVLSLALVYVTIILSWYGYHKSIQKYPYNQKNWSKLRFSLDVFILVVYAHLVFAALHVSKVLFGLGIVFVLYALDGQIRRCELADKKVSKPWLALLCAAFFFLARGFVPQPWPALVVALIILVGYRGVRAKLGYPTIRTVGVDIDGVLCDQISPVLERVQKGGKGIGLQKADIKDWYFRFDNTDIAKEIETALLDETFVPEMPVIQGSTVGMKKLYSNPSCHIVIATSRPLETQQSTINWVKTHFQFHEFVNTREVGKHNLGLDILIDDNLPNIKQFAASGGIAVLVTQPWNRVEKDPDLDRFVEEGKILHAEDWAEIVITVERLLAC